MTSESRRTAKVVWSHVSEAEGEVLPYRVEMWDPRSRKVERVLARAARTTLARAIFTAAQQEFPHRRITLRRGLRIIAETS